MGLFELVIALLFAGALFALWSDRLGVPYPAMLALVGALITLVPGAPSVTLDPELALTLFVAPTLLDAAYDASPRDLRRNLWSLLGLAVVLVLLTVVSVGVVALQMMPGLGRGLRAGGDRGPAGRLRGDGGAAQAEAPAPADGDPRGGEPVQRRDGAAHLPGGGRGGDDRGVLGMEAGAAAAADLRRRRGAALVAGEALHPGLGPGERHPGERAAPVREHVRGVDHRRPSGAVGDHHDGRVRDDHRPARGRADERALPDRLLRGLGRGGAGAERAGLRADRPAAARDPLPGAGAGVADLRALRGGGVSDGDRGPHRVGDDLRLGGGVEAPEAGAEAGTGGADGGQRDPGVVVRDARDRHAGRGAGAAEWHAGLSAPGPDRLLGVLRGGDDA